MALHLPFCDVRNVDMIQPRLQHPLPRFFGAGAELPVEQRDVRFFLGRRREEVLHVSVLLFVVVEGALLPPGAWRLAPPAQAPAPGLFLYGDRRSPIMPACPLNLIMLPPPLCPTAGPAPHMPHTPLPP